MRLPELQRQGLRAGILRVFASELLVIPTGILTVVFLTRRLGPAGYGMLAIAGAFIDWAEWAVTTTFSRVAVKFVSEATDWRPVASRTVQLHFAVGLGIGAALALLATPIAALMHEPTLAGYLRLYAIDLPVFCLAQAHRDVLIGRGYFKQRAVAGAWRWLARLGFIVLLVELGLSVEGAIIGGIASSLVELAICRWYVRPALFSRAAFPIGPLWAYLAPLSLYALGVKLYDKLDLVTFKALGGSAAAAGIYSGAESLTMFPALLATAFAPLLLSALGESLREGDLSAAKERSRRALRAMLLVLPLAGMQLGMSKEMVGALYGEAFLTATPLFDVMVFGAVALFMVAVLTSIMVAAGKPAWTVRVIVPMVLAQLIGDLLLIPKLGALGAAWVTTVCALAGWLVATALVYRLWGLLPPAATLLRSVAIGVGCYLAAASWPTTGALIYLKFALLCLAVLAIFWRAGDLAGMGFRPAAPADART